MAATSIGGGEWLVGPAAAVKYSSSIFLIATVAIAAAAGSPKVLPVEPDGGIGGEIVLPVEPDGGIGN